MQRSGGRNVPRASHPNVEDQMRSPVKSPPRVPLLRVFEPSSPTKSTVKTENSKSSACPQTMSHQSLLNQQGLQVHPAKVDSHKGIQKQSHLYSTKLSRPQASSSQFQSQLGQHSSDPRLSGSKSLDPSKQIKDTQSTSLEPAHLTLPYPSNRTPDSAERHIPRASHHRNNCHGHQNHVNIESPESAGEIPSSFANSSKADMSEVQRSSQVPSQGSTTAIDTAVHGTKVSTLDNDQSLDHHQNRMNPRKRTDHGASLQQRPSVRSAYGIVLDPGNPSINADAIGITQTLDHRDHNISAPGSGTAMNITVGQEVPLAFTESLPNAEGGVCFAGNWARDDSDDTDTQSITTLSTNAEELLTRRRSLLRRGQELARWLAAIENISRPESYLRFAQQGLWSMIVHVASTLHYGSPSIKILLFTDADKVGGKERLQAAGEVALALVYVVLLLNLTMILRKLMVMTLRVAYWIWHPFTALATVVRWCLIV